MIYKNVNLKKKKEINGPSVVAIKYDENLSKDKKVLYQGRGEMAEKIIDMAKKNNIDIEQDKSLLANLIDMDLGNNIPPQLYAVISEVLLLLEKMEKEL
ncbi:EscU/YscU/HrcU family type III secretion system export apparatus switch protein [Dethiothermospora halolimnae]|uniref:EscU/YscU/HrcU family type III secretion system export apparatus switch protein n=1 Tax=Dethiothermospora halolimnae TaxID=3114390 RepID=UPI003CCBBCE9